MPSLRRIFFIVLAVLGLALTLTYYRFEFDRIAKLRESIVKGEAELNRRKENVRIYREKVDFYKTKEGIQHLAREQYNLVQKGEQVFLLVSPDQRDFDQNQNQTEQKLDSEFFNGE